MSVGLLLSLIHLQITNGLSEYRLPTTIKPIHYDLQLQFHFNQTTDSSFMSGMSHILLNITHPQPMYIEDTQSYIFQVKLNMGSNINIIDSSLDFQALNETLHFVDFIHNKETQIATFNYDADIIHQDIIDSQSDTISAEIYLLFNTKLINDYNAGMYITSYEYNETIIQNAVSSFGLTDARLAFPCFDEPAFKATFDFSIIAPLNTTVISNTAVLGEQPLNNEICKYQYSWGPSTKCKTVIFETTPIIAPYVLTIFVGEYKSVSDVDVNNIMHNVWAPINEYEYGEFALETGLKVLPYFEDLFIFDYGLNKMDNIAVSSFPWGAMESYGAVVYNKNYVLTGYSAEKSYIAQLVAHEYAHMWFGDIVTCKWWDDTWLNEGFAQFYGYDTAHIFYPELHIFTDWINEKKDMMVKDISIYTETIVGENIESVSEILDMFGDYQYTKAGAVLEMMKYVMGNETFNKSIVEYIRTYEHINADSKNLIHIFNSYYEHSGDMLHSYIMQPGVPVVYVDADVYENNINFNIKQQRFIKQGPQFYSEPYFDPDNVKRQFDEQSWWVNLKIFGANGIIESTDEINNESTSINSMREIGLVGEEYYLFNNEFNNYHSTVYGDALFEMILSCWKSISYWNQMNIIFDRYNQIISNYVSTASYLELMKTSISAYYDLYEKNIYNNYETNIQWNTIIESLKQVDDMICGFYDNDNLLDNYRNFSTQLLKPLYNKLNGYNLNHNYKGNNTQKIIHLRNEIIVSLIRFQDEDVINIGYNIIKNMNEIKLSDGYIEGIDSNSLRPVIIAAMAKSDTEIFYKIINLYNHENSTYVIKTFIRESFSVVQDNEVIKKAYALIMRGNDGYNSNVNVDFGIAWYKINALNYLSTCNGINYVWNQLTVDKKNGTDFEYLLNTGYYSSGLTALTSLPKRFSTVSKLDEIVEYYLGENSHLYKNEDTKTAANMTLEDIAANIKWVSYNNHTLKQFLAMYGKENKTALLITTEYIDETKPTDETDDYSYHFVSLFVFIAHLFLIIYYQ